MSVLLLGVAPPNSDAPGANGGPAFVGTDSGRRLARIIGCEDIDLPDLFTCDNLFRQPTNVLDRELARAGARRAVRQSECSVVVAAGSMPRYGVYAQHLDWLEWGSILGPDLGELRVAAIPHPSGRTRWWNSAGNRHRAHEFFIELIEREGLRV